KTGNVRKQRFYAAAPLILWVLITALTMYLFPRQGLQPFREFRLGEISPEEIIAPFTFDLMKSESELKVEREEASMQVAPVFVRSDSVHTIMLTRLRDSLSKIREAAAYIHASDTTGGPLGPYGREALNEIRSEFELSINDNAWRYLIDSTQNGVLPTREDHLRTVLRDLYSRGVLNVPIEQIETVDGNIRIIDGSEEQSIEPDRLFDYESAHEEALARLSELMGVDLVADQDSTLKIAYEMLGSFIRPNFAYDPQETELRRERAIAQVPITKGTVFRNERIIDSNERVEQQHMDKLHSLELELADMAGRDEGMWQMVMPWVGRFLFAGSIFFFLGYWLFRFHYDIYRKFNELMLIWSVLAGMILLYGILFLRHDINLYLFPAALGAVILTIAFKARIALLYSIIVSLIIGGLAGYDLQATLLILLPAAVSIFAVLRVRTRLHIMRSGALIFASGLLVLLIRHTIALQFEQEILSEIGYIAINAVSTPLIALGMLLIIEPIFKVTSDLSLLELADLNRPLLKRLSMEAPGTYHHSIMVGNLAESAAEKIDANTLLVRAGAYYHDIGKMARREYFVENQPGSENVHDTLEPEESAKMLADHVIRGVEIADKFRVPEKIKEFIREHHGTSLMVYFYDKALSVRPEGTVDAEQFRYPGPKPQSKETGILMLADSAEAATRSLDDPSTENIQEKVREVVINKYKDGELDECPLTMNDLGRSIEAFVPILQGMHHHRIRYPSRSELESHLSKAKTQKSESVTAESTVEEKS
ncbi:MAG TPA: HDIG domain-containing protein, partial [Bacteroidetes bacterium]|nr:HDIG domain-containing protein [Bacteroidota bacterium]HEX05412.1 HDIG domain-containing protein [Bacteroidota bacterium]